jgi:hypothetical protein
VNTSFIVGLAVGVGAYWAFQHFSGKGNTGKAAKGNRGY